MGGIIMKKINISKDLLLKLYVNQHLTVYQIADELGVSRQTICNKLAEHGIEKECPNLKVSLKLKRH